MIEIVKENGSVTDKREIPVNLRPVGDPKGDEKIYIEDYIETFIRQIAMKDDKAKVLILYGENRQEEEMLHHYICGALLADDVVEDDKILFKDSIWSEINRKAGHFFPNLQVMGWVYIRYDLADFAQGRVQYTHNQSFRKDQNIYIEYSANEKKEQVYLVEKGNLKKQSGYFIYYDQNEDMQNYMVTIKQDEPEELKPEVDMAARKCRGIVRGRQEELKHRQTMGMLYGTSMAMLLVITIVGITLLNNYNKMQDMERVLFDISSQMAENGKGGAKDTDIMSEAGELSDEEPVYEESEEKPAEPVGNNEAEFADANSGGEGDAPETATNEDAAMAPEPAGGQTGTDAETTATEATAGETDKAVITDSPAENMTADNATTENTALQDEIVLHDNDEADIEPADNSAQTGQSYQIEKGDTLSKISLRFYGDESRVDEICRLNQIRDKNEIQYGVNIVLP